MCGQEGELKKAGLSFRASKTPPVAAPGYRQSPGSSETSQNIHQAPFPALIAFQAQPAPSTGPRERTQLPVSSVRSPCARIPEEVVGPGTKVVSGL